MKRNKVILDQVLVSAANFFLFVMATRLLSIEDWGSFSIAFAVVIFLQGFHRAIVILPMVSYSRTRSNLLEHSQYWWSYNFRFALYISTFLFCLFMLFWVFDLAGTAEILISAVLLPILIIQEFMRRWVIQAEKFIHLLKMSAIYFVAVLCLSWVLWAIPSLGTLVFIVFVSALLSIVYLYYSIAKGVLVNCDINELDLGHAKFGFHSCLNHFAQSFYGYAGIQIMTGALVGPVASATLSATRNIIQPVLLLIRAADSFDKPRASAEYAKSGFVGAKNSLFKSLKPIYAVAFSYILLLAFFGSDVINLLYGEKYGHASSELLLWLVICGLMILMQPLESLYVILRRADALFYAKVSSAIVCVPIFFLVVPIYGTFGSLIAMAIGWLVCFLAALGVLKLVILPAERRLNKSE